MSKRSEKRERRNYGDEFRRNAISLVEDQGYTNAQITDGHFEAFNNREPVSKGGTHSGTIPPQTEANVGESSVPPCVPQPVKRRKPRKTLGSRGFQ